MSDWIDAKDTYTYAVYEKGEVTHWETGDELPENYFDESYKWPNAINKTYPAELGCGGTVEDTSIASVSSEFDEEVIAKEYDNDSIDSTGPGCPHKDMTVLYIPHSEDKDLGSSILSMSNDLWKEIATEANYWEDLVKNLSTDTDNTREKVAQALHKNDTGSSKLTEVKVLGAGRSIWVPSTTVKEHVRKGKNIPASKRKGYFRKYQLDEQTIKDSHKKLGELEVKVDANLPGGKKIEIRGVDQEKLIKALNGPLEKAVNDYLKVESKASGNILELINDDLGKSLDKVNKNLMKYMEPKATTVVENESIQWEHGYGAQLGRYYASGETGAKIDIAKMEINATISGSLQYSAVEGRAHGHFYFPNKNGGHIILKGRIPKEKGKTRTTLDFGYFRAELTLEADGFVGASLMGSAKVGFNYDKDKKKMVVSPDDVGKESGATASMKAFIGVEASGKIVGALAWASPEEQKKNSFKELLSVGVGGTAAAGIGAELDFFLGYEKDKGRIVFRAKGSLVIGLGAGGELLGSVGTAQIFELTAFIYHQLNNNNFSYLDFIEEDAYNANIAILLISIEAVGDVVTYISSSPIIKNISQAYLDAKTYLEKREVTKEKAETMATNILKNPDILNHAPPEVKGMCLYSLSHTFYNSFEEDQEEAIIKILERCQTREEFRKVTSRITEKGEKSTFAEGVKRLDAIIDGFDNRNFSRLKKKFATLLNIDSYPEAPDKMRPIRPRVMYA